MPMRPPSRLSADIVAMQHDAASGVIFSPLLLMHHYRYVFRVFFELPPCLRAQICRRQPACPIVDARDASARYSEKMMMPAIVA